MVRVGVFAAGLVLAGLGAAVAGSVAGELTAPATTTAVRLVLLVAGALVAGPGLVHALGGASGTWHRRVAWASGLLAAAAALAGYLHGDVGRTGTLVWVVAALAVPALLETRRTRPVWTVPVAALPVTALTAVTLGSGHAGAAFAADVVYAVTTAVLLGALATLALRMLDRAGSGAGHAGSSRPAAGIADGLRAGQQDAQPGAGTEPGRPATGQGGRATSSRGGRYAAGLDQDGRAVGARSNSPDVLIDVRSGSASSGPAAAPGWPVRGEIVGLAAAVVAAFAGVAQVLTAGPYSVTDLVGTAYGRTALVAVVLPALVAAVLAGPCRTALRRAAPVATGAARRDGVRHDGVRSGDPYRRAAPHVRGAATVDGVPQPVDVPDAVDGDMADAAGGGAAPVPRDGRGVASAGHGVPADRLRDGVLAGATGAVVAVGVASAAVAGLLPAPAPAAVPGQALLRTVALDGENVPLLIAPMRPGPNLVQIGGSGYTTADDAGTEAPEEPGPGTSSGASGGAASGGAASGGAAAHGAAANGAPAIGPAADGARITDPAADGTVGSGVVGGAPVHGTTGGTAGHGGTAVGRAGHDMVEHAGPATVEAGSDPVSFTTRPAARGGWAVVDIPAGTSSVTVTMGGDSATVPVDVGDTAGDAPSSALTGRDGPECASAIVGAALTGPSREVTGCPSQTLDPDQARALTATVRTMAGKGARNVRLVGDASTRSVAAARLVRDEGTRAGLAFTTDAVNDPNSAIVVVSGWEQAVGVLGEVRERSATTPTHLGGTFLAPWLLTGDVLRQTASAFLPLSFAPNEPDAQRFALALAATHPDTAPSASGYLAWARESGVRTDPRPSLYGAAAVNVPMSIEPQGSSGHHGGPDPAAWFPGGTVVPVSGPMEGSP